MKALIDVTNNGTYVLYYQNNDVRRTIIFQKLTYYQATVGPVTQILLFLTGTSRFKADSSRVIFCCQYSALQWKNNIFEQQDNVQANWCIGFTNGIYFEELRKTFKKHIRNYNEQLYIFNLARLMQIRITATPNIMIYDLVEYNDQNYLY